MKVTVYGVASPDEARRLEAAGADVIGVFLGDRPGGRVLDEETAVRIRQAVSNAEICVEHRSSTPDPALASRLGARWIQVPWNQDAPQSWREQLAVEGVGWVLGRVPADEDDDPEWVVSRWTGYDAPTPDWVYVEVFPDLTDPWPTLQDSSPDEVDAADLDRMAAERPVVFSLPLTEEQIPQARGLFPHAYGFALTLRGRHGEVPGATTIDVEEALHLLEALRR
ncbi:hypothetical protein [Geodermatophilus poikilotrophus]|uniref:Phosphoribosylanthranilate isomerase n=1 Tax=Geodermatophilus poikilotrophus TaxID=1333667 RepID=A0A1I0IMU3_9ACTN|nr:hypothetical protein [Geodermatophilus poikilotrophus]SET97711.1 Phosphoribosylanthranilate isomerase [Geodermatophilus poikilotrophus]